MNMNTRKFSEILANIKYNNNINPGFQKFNLLYQYSYMVIIFVDPIIIFNVDSMLNLFIQWVRVGFDDKLKTIF